MKTHEWTGRYALLFFDCVMGFGVFFCQDIPGALQSYIQGIRVPCYNRSGNSNINTTCCDDCLGLGPDEFNDLYSVYSWMSAILALPGGYIIDRIGNRASAVLVSFFATAGSCTFAVAVSFGIRGTPAMFPLMIVGRLLLGVSAGCTLVVQDRIAAFWFVDKLALAFGITYTTERLGNVVNFFVTQNIFSIFGITGAFWAGGIVCLCSLFGGVMYAVLDMYGTKKLDTESQAEMISVPVHFSDIKRFPLPYWIIALMISSFYSCFIPFVGNGSKFIEDKYGYSPKDASYVNGVIYDTCCILFPVLGVILDKKGKRSYILLVATYITVPIFPLMYFTSVIHPLVFSVWLGIMYTFVILCMWSLVAIIVPSSSLGTACGIAAFLQGLGMGLTNLAIGQLLIGLEKSTNKSERMAKWKWVLILLMSISAFCALCGTLLNFSNKSLLKKMNSAALSNDEDKKRLKDDNDNERKRLLPNVIESTSYSSYDSGTAGSNYSIQ